MGQNLDLDQLEAQARSMEAYREKTLEGLGLTKSNLADAWARGSKVEIKDDASPYLVNVCDDPLLSGCLTYSLPVKQHVTIGRSKNCMINLDGVGIQNRMCSIAHHDASPSAVPERTSLESRRTLRQPLEAFSR